MKVEYVPKEEGRRRESERRAKESLRRIPVEAIAAVVEDFGSLVVLLRFVLGFVEGEDGSFVLVLLAGLCACIYSGKGGNEKGCERVRNKWCVLFLEIGIHHS